jgi:hypothetical protein
VSAASHNQATQERSALLRELEHLIGLGPGSDYRSLARVREIISTLESGQNGYVREKAFAVMENFELWRSEHRWERYCRRDPKAFRIRLLAAIAKLRMLFRD